jgi:hypothetical protein
MEVIINEKKKKKSTPTQAGQKEAGEKEEEC